MSDGSLKEEFIKYFGESKWNEEEMIGKLIPLTFDVCDILCIDYIPLY